MNSLQWKINRLKAMGAGEVVHRLVEFFSQHWEKWRLEKGWEPLPAQQVTSRTSLFTGGESCVAKWQESFSLDATALDCLLDHRVDFFNHDPLAIGNPVQWHRDPLTKTLAPEGEYGKMLNYRDDSLCGNVKFLWELGRHQHLVPLAAAYVLTGRKVYRDTVTAQIESWIEQNRFGRGIHWCSALEVSLRLLSWSVVHGLFQLREGEKGLFAAVSDPQQLGNSIYQHAWFVAHFFSRYSSANNHLIGELTGLWTGTQVFHLGTEGEEWAEIAHSGLESEAGKQVFADGVNREQALYYHLWVLEYFLFASQVGARAGRPFSEKFMQTISAMVDFLEAMVPSGGVPPQIGDADDGFVVRFEPSWPQQPYHDVLEACRIVLKNKLSPAASQKGFWYGAMAATCSDPSQSGVVREQAPYPRVFPLGGYGVLGDDRVHLVFDAGPLGFLSLAAHGHADALSFCLAIDGAWWLVDPGTYAYHSAPVWRDYFRGTSAHNTLCIDGQDQSLAGGPFLWLRHAPVRFEGCGSPEPGRQWVAGSHCGYRNVQHHRSIEFDCEKQEIIITDNLTGSGSHLLTLHFHFAPEVRVSSGRENLWVARREQSTSSLEMETESTWAWQTFEASQDPMAGWYSPALDTKVAAVTLRGERIATLPLEAKTILRLR